MYGFRNLHHLRFWRALSASGAILSAVCVMGGVIWGAESTPAERTDLDPRNIVAGDIIPSEGYADQPYVARTRDHAWLCVMTTGKGREGQRGQHIISMRTKDHGRTWEPPVALEQSDGPESSYAVLLKVPSGRIYAFYNHNTDGVTEAKREDGGAYERVDCLGHYVFKYTDDDGRSWSAKRYEVPVRSFQCDIQNVYGGRLRFFWNVGQPIIVGDTAILTLHKVGALGAGFYAQSEGAFLSSKNLLTESDPEKITFQTLPDGETGLRAPPGGGRIAEEQNVVALSDGSLFCVYRTTAGWPASSYSRDQGHSWSPPAFMTYSPDGRRVKHPRAANFVWKTTSGRYLYWFHNHGGPAIGRMSLDFHSSSGSPYDDRNPAWLMAGSERDTPRGKVIVWSQPEILLYDDDPFIKISYPNLVEEAGHFFITETQKNVGHVHEISSALIAGLFGQAENHAVAREGLALELPAGKPLPVAIELPAFPPLNVRDDNRPDFGTRDLRGGFSLDLWFRLDSVAAGQSLLDSRDAEGKGLLIATTAAGTIALTMNDGRTESSWACDSGLIKAGRLQHVVITVDGGPKIITFVVDGVLNDGGDARQFGWGRYNPNLRAPNGAAHARLSPAVKSLRIYHRALRTSEAVGNFQHGL